MKTLKTLALAFITTLTLSITSCDKDEPETPTPADEHKNDIVGVWECIKENTPSAEHYTLDIKSNGTFTGSYSYQYSYMDSPTVYYEHGTWTYDSEDGSWWLSQSGFGNHLYGIYIMINNQLVCSLKNAAFNRIRSTEQEDPELAKLYGTWKGNISGDYFALTFSNDGKMNETVDGHDFGSVGYTFKDGELTFDENTVLENTIGSAPIVVKFASDNKSIQIYKKSDPGYKYTLIKQ